MSGEPSLGSPRYAKVPAAIDIITKVIIILARKMAQSIKEFIDLLLISR
jgi:hypothetical protein